MTRFRKKQLEVEAVQWTGENVKDVGEFTAPAVPRMDTQTRTLYLGGDEIARVGDYIVRRICGDFVALTANEFQATYEPADHPAQPVEGKSWTICTNCSRVVEIEDEGACDCNLRGETPNRIEVVPAQPVEGTYTREQLTPERIKQIEFDAWLSFRPEFAEVLTAFRSAFGTDTSAAAGDDPNSEYSRAVAQSAIDKGKGGEDG